MANIVSDLAPIINTSGSSVNTILIGNIDDASSVTIFFSTGTNILTSNCKFIITPWEPVAPYPVNMTSSMFFTDVLMGSSLFLTSGGKAFTISNISFRGIGIQTSVNTITTGTTIATATKQISV